MPTYPEEARDTAIKRAVKKDKPKLEKVNDMERTKRVIERSNPKDFTVIHTDTSWFVE